MKSTHKLLSIFLIFAFLSIACQAVNRVLDIPLLTTAETPDTPNTPDTPDAPEQLNSLTYDQQFSIFDELWRIVNEEYLYDDFNGVDWDATYQKYQEKIDAGLSDEEFYLAMSDMIYALNDDHSAYLNPEEAAEEDAQYAGDTNFVGIGIWVAAVEERDRAVILLVFPGSPAEEAGLKSHDNILAIEGEPILDEEGELVDSILGLEGTPVTITVQTPGGEPRDLTITRSSISGSLPVSNELLTSPEGQRIGYILVPTFADSTIDDRVEEVIEELSTDGPLDGLILDNRLNEGGFNTVMENTLELFSGGLMGYFVNREGEEALRLSANDVESSTTVPLVVLVGLDTVSFGEIFSGILKDQGRATLIGETTDGNVETLWGYDFDDGSRAWIAHDTFRPANHPEDNWEQSGIIPHVTVLAAWDQLTFENDPVIQASLDFFDTSK